MSWLNNLWWQVRGVDSCDYRKLCAFCGASGQAHWSLNGCLRFRAQETKSRRCPKCGECVLFASAGYCMKCGYDVHFLQAGGKNSMKRLVHAAKIAIGLSLALYGLAVEVISEVKKL